MKFAIEKGVPIPPKLGEGFITDLRTTMKDMKPGESFTILFNTVRPQNKVKVSFHLVKQELEKNHKLYFQSRTVKVGIPPADAMRVWCVEPPKPKT